MKPLPSVVLRLLERLPEETHKIILNTNQQGQWEIEVFTRYRVDEPPPAAITVLAQKARAKRATRSPY